MSNFLAIAAVTETLRNLLQVALQKEDSSIRVTIMPPDKARENNQDSRNRVNLFLYQTTRNAAWRNTDMPHQVKSGETGHPPLALNLHYLITFYSDNDDDSKNHRWLGRVESLLHDHPLLGSDEIKNALVENDLHAQVERVRLTPLELSLEEKSKLWTTFQTQYRLSVAYQVSVVLIESMRPTKTPLPVLARGRPDPITGREPGVASQADLTPPFPTLVDIAMPKGQPNALLGDVLIINGHHLSAPGATITVKIKHQRLLLERLLDLQPGATATEISALVPNRPGDFPAGFYTLAVTVTTKDDQGNDIVQPMNELAFGLAPKIEKNPPITAERRGNELAITLTCAPAVLPEHEQHVSLLLGEHEIAAPVRTAASNALTFVAPEAQAKKISPGNYFVRLRVDGVDSLLINYAATPRAFDSSQKVTIP